MHEVFAEGEEVTEIQQQIVELVTVLAWPAAIVAIALIFRPRSKK